MNVADRVGDNESRLKFELKEIMVCHGEVPFDETNQWGDRSTAVFFGLFSFLECLY